MTWFDPSGSSLLGPSSEWLWTMLSTVAVIVSLLAIYRELRLQTAVKETQQVNDTIAEWESERLARQRLRLYQGLRDGERVPDVNASWRIANYWEKTACLAREGHLNLRLLIENGGLDSVMFWSILQDFVHDVRAERNLPSAYEHFEWLAEQGRRSRHDVSHLERETTPERLAMMIEDEETFIALEVALRTPGG